MGYFIGADLGTSSLKLMLLDEKGTVKNTVSELAAILENMGKPSLPS